MSDYKEIKSKVIELFKNSGCSVEMIEECGESYFKIKCGVEIFVEYEFVAACKRIFTVSINGELKDSMFGRSWGMLEKLINLFSEVKITGFKGESAERNCPITRVCFEVIRAGESNFWL